VVADFSIVIKSYGEIIDQVNKKFSRKFNLYPEQDAEMNATVMNEIDARNKQQDKGKLTHLYRPDKDKEILKGRVEINEEGELFQKALAIYQKYKELD